MPDSVITFVRLGHPSQRRRRIIPIGLSWLLLVGLTFTAAPLSSATPLPQRVYVWHRAWTTEVKQSLAECAPSFAAVDVLLAEISWQNGGPLIHRITPDWPAMRKTSRPTGIVVRIGPYKGAWGSENLDTKTVVDCCRSILAETRENGIEPAELQLDFDAATARLAQYSDLLRIIRREVKPARLTITALPDWLRSADFSPLIQETDAYVLQVHSIEKPVTTSDDFTLFDPARAAGWIAQAARLNHPYRIALPTYGYRLIFDVAGKFIALEAEGSVRTWAPEQQIRTVIADATALAKFVQQLLASPPPACESLVWFRLPTDNDGLAWSWPALRAVMQGRSPVTNLVLVARPNIGGTHDLRLENRGEADSIPDAFRVTWLEAQLLASDGLAGWHFERPDSRSLIARPPPHESNGALRPGESLQVGWLRFDQLTTPTVVPFP